MSGNMGDPPPSDNVWFGGLPADLDKNFFQQALSSYGLVVDCRPLPPKAEGQRSCAMVRFGSVEDATWIVQNLNGNVIPGFPDPVQCRFANPPRNQGIPSHSGQVGQVIPPKRTASAPVPTQQRFKTQMCRYFVSMGYCRNGVDCTYAHSLADMRGDVAPVGQPYPVVPSPGKGIGKRRFADLLNAIKTQGVLGGGRVPPECQVCISNLPPDTDDEGLFRLFTPFGAIAPSGVKAMLNPDGSCTGVGYADFSDSTCAATAVMALNGWELPNGQSISMCHKAPNGQFIMNSPPGDPGKGRGDNGGTVAFPSSPDGAMKQPLAGNSGTTSGLGDNSGTVALPSSPDGVMTQPVAGSSGAEPIVAVVDTPGDPPAPGGSVGGIDQNQVLGTQPNITVGDAAGGTDLTSQPDGKLY